MATLAIGNDSIPIESLQQIFANTPFPCQCNIQNHAGDKALLVFGLTIYGGGVGTATINDFNSLLSIISNIEGFARLHRLTHCASLTTIEPVTVNLEMPAVVEPAIVPSQTIDTKPAEVPTVIENQNLFRKPKKVTGDNNV